MSLTNGSISILLAYGSTVVSLPLDLFASQADFRHTAKLTKVLYCVPKHDIVLSPGVSGVYVKTNQQKGET